MKKRNAVFALILSALFLSSLFAAGCKKKHTHVWEESYYTEDAEYHWKKCKNCSETSGKEKHAYDGDNDTDCNVCGHERQVSSGGIAEGQIKIISAKTGGDLEEAYICWEPLAGANAYAVYYSGEDGQEHRLDDMLVRKYTDYYRADAIGLKAGTYSLRVVALDSGKQPIETSSTTVSGITVAAHDRSGFAFTDGHMPGAYNADGTLKQNAIVVYVTNNNKDTVTVKLNKEGRGEVDCTGLQNIILAYKKGKEKRPMAIRVIGNLTDPSVLTKGDIYLDTVTAPMTIEGVGNDATINGFGIVLKNCVDTEIRNLGFMNCNSEEGDNLGLQQNNSYIWTHNNDMFYGDAGTDADQIKGDGALDTKTSTHITHSYNHFWDSGKSNLQGMKSESTDNLITYHHNWYDHSDSRHPRVRTCTVHVYNNYFDGNAKYGIGATMGSSVFAENNYFRSTAAMRPMMSSKQGTDAQGEGTFSGENGGIIKAYGNTYDCSDANLKLIDYKTNNTSFDCYTVDSRTEEIPQTVVTLSGGTAYNNFDTASSMYSYTADSAEDAMAKVKKYAGRVGGGDLTWTFDNSAEDGNYTVISALKSKLTAYKGDLKEVGGVAVISTGTGGSVSGNPSDGGNGGNTSDSGNSGSGDSGNGGTQDITTTPITGAVVLVFSSATDPTLTANDVVCTGGSFKAAGSFEANNATYNTSYSISDGSIVFTLGGNFKMTVYMTGDNKNGQPLADGKRLKVNGEKKSSAGSKVVVDSITGKVVLTKGDSCRICYIVLEKL